MEEVRSSRAGARRIANGGGRPGYDDVFGGPPRYAAVPLDYAEIFGGLSSSCSIPYLDLPAALDVDFAEPSGAAGFDYAEIFQGFGGGGFGLSYGELVAEPEAPELASESGRVTEETHFSQNVTEASSKPLDGPDGDHEACLDEDQFLSNSEHSDDGSKQFTASCNKTVWGSVEDTVNGTTENTVNGTTENTQLHKVPAFTVVINACSPLHNEINDNPLNMMDHGLKADTNGGDSDMKPEVLPSTSGGSIQSSVIGQTDDKHLATEDHAAEDVSLNVKQHSRSSSYHSISSGDISCTDATYVTVSDISLRTQPLQVAPPSRLPPKFGNKKENPVTRMHTNFKADLNGTGIFRHVMNNQTQFGNSVSRKHSLHRNAKDNPSFYDVEMDATSAAAASAAAMKEAMEQAQARLKSAKELMQRKRENTQSHNKHGHHEGKKYKEKQEDGAIEEVRDFSEDRVQKTLVNEDQRMKSAVNVWQEAKPKVAADHEEKERHAAEESQWAIQGKEMKSSHILYNMDEETGEWKEDKQFYELINNEKKFRMVREDPEKEGIEKKQKVIEKSNEDTEIETKLAKRNRKLWEINDARECEVKDKILRAGNMALREKEIKEIPSSIPDVHVQKENVNDQDGNHGSCKQEKSKKEMKLAQENHIGKEEEAKSVVSEEVSACGNSEKKVEPSNDDFKCKKDHGSGKEERRHNICEKELNITYINCEPQEGEMKVKQANKSGIQHADEEDIGVPNGSCVPEAAEKLKTTQLTSKHETLERTKGAADLECCTHEHINNLKGTAASLDHEESSPLNGTLEGCKWVENEKKLEVDEEPYEVDRNVKKLEISEEDLQQTQNENSREVFTEALQNHNEMKAKEIPAKVEQHEEKQDAAQVIYEAPQDHNEREKKESPVKVEQNQKKQDAVSVICDLEGSKKLTVAEGDCVHQEDGKDEEELKKDCRLNEAEEFCQRVVKGDLKSPQEDNILRTKGDILATSDNATESRDTENTIPDTQVEEKDKEGRVDRERELEKEQARRLEEEKEREREREKDRLAVEKGTCENHERALAEARERAERIAVERLTAEARQRALAEAREKAEKASREGKLKAELAAVERATAEAWERAAERTLVEKAASDARERAERLNASSRDRMRKDYESGDFFKGSTKEDNGTRTKDVSCAEQHQSVGPSISVQKYSHKNFSTGKFEEVQIESPLRCKARQERHQRTVERAAKALAEKNLRDILAQREQAERNRLAESLDAEIRRWSSGKEGNLRALLSTLQYILGPESGWQPIPLNDVITAAAVKKAYRKATLCVHPDKLQQRGANIQQKYICEKVFDLLKEAWSRFNSEER